MSVAVQGTGLGLLLAQVIDGAVRGDAVEPGREAVARIEAGEREVHLEEDLLGQVQGAVPLSGVPVDVVHQRPLVPPDQRLEGARGRRSARPRPTARRFRSSRPAGRPAGQGRLGLGFNSLAP